jgi:uncharacterized protein YegL
MKKNEEMIKDRKGNEMSIKNTELVFIIDKSGSMSGFEDDAIGGFNSMIEKQKSVEGDVIVSTVLFDGRSKVVHDRVPIERIDPMTRNDYCVGGCTALLDAIGGAIHHIGNVHKYARAEDVPAKTIFVITTDGMENASRNYTRDRVKEMIKRQSEKYSWEFLFVAANIDAVETAGSIGIREERAANYKQTKGGYETCYKAMSSFVTMSRSDMPIDRLDSWKNVFEDECDEQK